MSTYRVVLLGTCLCVVFSPACGGRSGLDDFSRNARDIAVSPGTGDDQKDAGGASEPDSGEMVTDDDAGTTDDAGTSTDAGKPNDDRGVGAECERDRQCGDDGATCVTEIEIFMGFGIEFPGGYCSVQGCEDDSECPDGSGCLNLFGTNTCMQRCEEDGECRASEGYRCAAVRGGPGGPGGPGGRPRPSFCLPPFGRPMPGGNSGGGGMGGNNGGPDVSQACMFVCRGDRIRTQICIATNDLSVCMAGGSFGGS